MDPRVEVIKDRLSNICKVIPVASGKGGVGKSLISSVMALIASREENYEVGLLDLDLHSPSTHIILGAENLDFPEEEKGIIPSFIGDIRYMSTVYYSREKPAPLRGIDITNAIREILSITRWGELDYLIIDMPPGIGDETLDTIQLIPDSEFLIVTTPSKVAMNTVKKLISMLNEIEIPIEGIIENMVTENTPDISDQVKGLEVPYLGSVMHDFNIEKAIGNPDQLLKTDFARDLRDTISL